MPASSSGGPGGQPAEVALPQLIFGEADVVRRRDERQGKLDSDDHDPSNALASTDGAARLVELHPALEDIAFCVDGRCAFEPVALAHELVDDVDLDAGVQPQIR